MQYSFCGVIIMFGQCYTLRPAREIQYQTFSHFRSLNNSAYTILLNTRSISLMYNIEASGTYVLNVYKTIHSNI